MNAARLSTLTTGTAARTSRAVWCGAVVRPVVQLEAGEIVPRPPGLVTPPDLQQLLTSFSSSGAVKQVASARGIVDCYGMFPQMGARTILPRL